MAPPDFSSPDYWVLINGNALPRVYVPRQVEQSPTTRSVWRNLRRKTSIRGRRPMSRKGPVELPDACRGSAEIVAEIPARVTVACDMQTPGLVVLADLWDSGWRAYWEGKPVPILRTNHAIRGVVVPQGKGTLEFRYEPASLTWGWRLCGGRGFLC